MICFLLGRVGSLPVLREYFLVGLGATICYFCGSLFFPLISFFEKLVYHLLIWKKKVAYQQSIGFGFKRESHMINGIL